MLDGLAAPTFLILTNRNGLGTEAILLRFAKRKPGLTFVYLGYWIDGCRKNVLQGAILPS